MKNGQNTSHAVMAQRSEALDSLDDFPTPPWATRALIEHVIGMQKDLSQMTCLEPACNRGFMSIVLEEYFGQVISSDVHPYGYGEVADFLGENDDPNGLIAAAGVDWIITNPPFRLGEAFILKALSKARRGVAMLTRTVFIESVGRYERIFSQVPPTKFAQFTERVPMVKGRLDKRASTATGYCWLVWDKKSRSKSKSQLVWVPPCRKVLERESDYQMPTKQLRQRTAIQPVLTQRVLETVPAPKIPRGKKPRQIMPDLFA
jgi:hypothetical protein